MAQNRPKTAPELKYDRGFVILVIFYVGCTYLELKSSTERPIHAKSVIFLEFLLVSGPDFVNFLGVDFRRNPGRSMYGNQIAKFPKAVHLISPEELLTCQK